MAHARIDSVYLGLRYPGFPSLTVVEQRLTIASVAKTTSTRMGEDMSTQRWQRAALFVAVLALATTAVQAAPPGTCDLLNNTVCHVPGDLIAQILAWLGR